MVDKPVQRSFCGKASDLCCISVNKIFDSARDKDCLEDIRVVFCDCYQEIADRANALRCKNVEAIDTNIALECIPFNRGFYQVTVRFYFCVTLEACLCNGRTEEIKGLAAFDKKIILYGSEKNVTAFTSDPNHNTFCPTLRDIECKTEPTLPTVTVEVASPVCLDVKTVERCRPFGNCCISVDTLPEHVTSYFSGNFTDDIGSKRVYVTIGMFTVIRMERPVQLVLPACNFCLPDKESTPQGCTDPCSVFGKMSFPYNEFYPYANLPAERDDRGGCCK